VTDAPITAAGLAPRLRQLREAHTLKQRELAAALRPERPASVALISAWESERAPAVPSEAWLSAYARLLAPDWAARRSRPRLLDDGELTPSERSDVADLVSELHALRHEALSAPESQAPAETGALGGRFWHFPDGQPIVIIGSRLPDDELRGFLYANPLHPDYMHMLRHADGGAVVELFGHLRAENPTSEVRFRTADQVREEDDLSGHVVIIGGGDRNPFAGWFADRTDDYVNIPRGATLPDAAGPKDRRFTTRSGELLPDYCDPIFADHDVHTTDTEWRDGAWQEVGVELPDILYDAAILARQPNPLNTTATATLCYGLYGRGTYGAVRTFTDARLRDSNEEYRQKRFGYLTSYWMLIRVLCSGRLTTTPDLNREYTRVLEWPE
jgi:transcriptional regulator with XRE-family HTH domain